MTFWVEIPVVPPLRRCFFGVFLVVQNIFSGRTSQVSDLVGFFQYLYIYIYILPETNIAPEKIMVGILGSFWNGLFFRCYVSFRECIYVCNLYKPI